LHGVHGQGADGVDAQLIDVLLYLDHLMTPLRRCPMGAERQR
jgi:hypothetical protein